MIAFPPCKINLGLNVLSKREDGFHNLETIFYPVQWTDILEIIPSEETTFTSSGISIPGEESENLCLKAYQLLQDDFKIAPVKIHLHKIIPIGAGLGGGSSDTAYTLRLLNSIFKLSLSTDQLKQYASKLGSDCSFFVEDRPMIGTGKGEILEPIELSLKKYYLVLIKSPIHVSTKEAYNNLIPKKPTHQLSEIVNGSINNWKDLLKNDFEESVFRKYPEIKVIKNKLYEEGAVYASMSGSGSSVFGLFEKPVSLREKFIGLDYWEGGLS